MDINSSHILHIKKSLSRVQLLYSFCRIWVAHVVDFGTVSETLWGFMSHALPYPALAHPRLIPKSTTAPSSCLLCTAMHSCQRASKLLAGSFHARHNQFSTSFSLLPANIFTRVPLRKADLNCSTSHSLIFIANTVFLGQTNLFVPAVSLNIWGIIMCLPEKCQKLNNIKAAYERTLCLSR